MRCVPVSVNRSSSRFRSVGAVILAFAAALVGLAQPASAEIVWSKGGAIWAMHDDGSGARQLIPLSAAPGMTSLRAPMPAPSGARLAFSGETTANKVTRTGLCGTFPYQYSCFTTHYGFNSTGTYRWAAGVVSRVSGAPAYCFNCTDGDNDPGPRADDSIVSYFQHCQGFLDQLSYDCVSAIKATSGEVYDACDSVGGVAPNPAGGAQVAYTGCASGGNDALVVTGPSRAGEHVVGCDDAEQRDPAWSPGGDRIVDAEGGTEPGIWSYAATNTACFAGDLRQVVVEPAGTTFSNPAFVGASRIVFDAGGELWSVPASCNACAFPSGATQLTSGGDNSDPAWTSDALAVPSGGGSGSGGGGGGGSGSGGGGGGGTTADITAPVVTTKSTAATQKVGSSRKITVKIGSTEAGTATVSGRLDVPGKDPVLAPKTGAVATGATLTLRLSLGTKAMRALRSAWAKGRRPVAVLTITVTDAAGNRTVATVRVKLRR